jgi:hypothetical protein
LDSGEIIGHFTIDEIYSPTEIKDWIGEQITLINNPRGAWVKFGYYTSGQGKPLPYFDIWFGPGESVKAAVIYKADEGIWWIHGYSDPIAWQIYNKFVEPELEPTEQIETVKEVEIIKPKPKPKPKDIPLPDAWLIFPPKRRKFTSLKPNENRLEYGDIDYLSDYELSEVREKLEHGGYSRIA